MVQSTSFRHLVFQDWSANPNSLKSRLVLAFFRLTQVLAMHSSIISRLLGGLSNVLYTIVVQWIMGIEIPPSVLAGKGLQLFHGVGLVVHPDSVLGDGCILRHCTTIGSKGITGLSAQVAPVLGDYVDVGCNSVIIGPISVGNQAVIGAGSVIVHDVPAYTVVCGNPGKVIGSRSSNKGSKVSSSAMLEARS
jgi:putative colanic acid biosynthesis acetyltransferase WcaB